MKLLSKLLTSAQNGVTFRVTDIHCTTPQKQNSSCNSKESYFHRDTDINWNRVISELLTFTPLLHRNKTVHKIWKRVTFTDTDIYLEWVTFIHTRYRNEMTDVHQMKLLSKLLISAQNGVTFRVTDIHCTTPQKQNSSCNSKESYFHRDTDINWK